MKARHRLRVGRVVDGVARLQIATNAQPFQAAPPADGRSRGSSAKFAGWRENHIDSRVPVSSRSGSCSKRAELAAVLPLPTTDTFQQDRGDSCRCKRMRDQGSRHPAADDGHTRFVRARKTGILPFDARAVAKPDRLPEAKVRWVRHCAAFGHSTSERGASAGPEITSPVGLNRDP